MKFLLFLSAFQGPVLGNKLLLWNLNHSQYKGYLLSELRGAGFRLLPATFEIGKGPLTLVLGVTFNYINQRDILHMV